MEAKPETWLADEEELLGKPLVVLLPLLLLVAGANIELPVLALLLPKPLDDAALLDELNAEPNKFDAGLVVASSVFLASKLPNDRPPNDENASAGLLSTLLVLSAAFDAGADSAFLASGCVLPDAGDAVAVPKLNAGADG